mgnify:CR=1 FL=1
MENEQLVGMCFEDFLVCFFCVFNVVSGDVSRLTGCRHTLANTTKRLSAAILVVLPCCPRTCREADQRVKVYR